MSSSSNTRSFPIFSLPQLMQGLCYKQMDVYDLISWTLGNKSVTDTVSLYKYSQLDLDVVISWEDGRFNAQICHFNQKNKVIGTWHIQWKNNKRPRNMQYIESDCVVINTYPSSSTTVIQSSNPISTVSSLMDHFQKIYRNINWNLRFEDVDMGEHSLYKWKYLSLASKIELVDSSIYPFHIEGFQSMLRPHQHLSIERGSVELENCPKVQRITINSSSFTADKFLNYNCDYFEVKEYSINYMDSLEFMNQWIAGEHKDLKMFTLFNADKEWLTENLLTVKYQEDSMIFRSGSRSIDCTDGYSLFRNDGTMGTLNFRENGVMHFVVWS